MKLNIGQKIVLFGLLPSIATIFFIYTIITEKIHVKAGADRIVKLSQYVINASELVHELQKERGASAMHADMPEMNECSPRGGRPVCRNGIKTPQKLRRSDLM